MILCLDKTLSFMHLDLNTFWIPSLSRSAYLLCCAETAVTSPSSQSCSVQYIDVPDENEQNVDAVDKTLDCIRIQKKAVGAQYKCLE